MRRDKLGYLSDDIERDYIEAAWQYAEAVLSGARPAARYEKKAVQRFAAMTFRDDIQFDVLAACAPCAFIELLPHIEGALGGQRIILSNWQIFLIINVFGWQRNGARLFNRFWLEVPRKNAKSMLSSGIALYMLGMEGEPGAQIYAAATTRQQANTVFRISQKMLKDTPLLKTFGYMLNAHRINHIESNSYYHALSRDANKFDGFNPYYVSLDEMHAHKTSEMYDVLVSGTGSRRSYLIGQITTAGSNLGGVGYDQHQYAQQVLDGQIVDESLFAVIYTVDDPEKWHLESEWIKANPNYGASVLAENFRNTAHIAQNNASERANFLTKHLNIWGHASHGWADVDDWDAGAVSEDEFDKLIEGNEPIAGADLSSRQDYAAFGLLWQIEGVYYWRVWIFAPQARVTDSAQVAKWCESGDIIVTPGGVVDLSVFRDKCEKIFKRYLPRKIGFDVYQAALLAADMKNLGYDCVEVPQTYRFLSPPMKELGGAIAERKIIHTGNRCMRWMMSNTQERTDGKGNIQPYKGASNLKIDGVSALLSAGAVLLTEADTIITLPDGPMRGGGVKVK